jgi:hypothetical protein
MTDSIIWVKPDIAVNLDAVAYIETKTDEGKIVFSTGAVISLDGKDSERLAKYLRGVFTVDVRMPGTFPSKNAQT